MDSVVLLNAKLYDYIINGVGMEQLPKNEHFWEELSYFIDNWHTKLTGANFLHVFMYVSVVANDINGPAEALRNFPP
ncbi:hypothetical protein N752_11765 [Desulforamulus aquiferis]|nr:hypothetical protein [Desulforamulus aquiferis]RYD05032.1 hypothetical protein N752_11765 [Desulforamulus aquiferis]